MLILQIAILLMVAAAGTAVVLTRDAKNQVIGLSYYGFLLALMFFLYQAPDVALSQIVIGAVALPLMFMLTLTKIRLNERLAERQKQQDQQGRHDRQEKAA